MSALTVLFGVLPLPLIFIVHDIEEFLVQHNWMQSHHADLEARFPWARRIIGRLLSLTPRAFAIAAAWELICILAVTAIVFTSFSFAAELWSAVFIAFTLHLVVHLGQAVLVRGYVPGLITAIFALPYLLYFFPEMWRTFGPLEFIAIAIGGMIFASLNLLLAHNIGLKFK